jgi:hypothetical protein
MIIAAEVKRDEQGYWTHPVLARSGCETSAELSYWLRTHKLQCFVMTMRDEAPEALLPDLRMKPRMPVAGYRNRRMMMMAGGLCPRYRRRTRLLLVSAYHKILTPPHGVVVQPRERGKASFPAPGVS